MIPDPYYRICRFACGFGKCELIIYSSSGSKPTLNSSALFGVLSIANWLIILFPASGIYLYETPFRVKPLAILDAPVSARFASVCKLATPILSQRPPLIYFADQRTMFMSFLIQLGRSSIGPHCNAISNFKRNLSALQQIWLLSTKACAAIAIKDFRAGALCALNLIPIAIRISFKRKAGCVSQPSNRRFPFGGAGARHFLRTSSSNCRS